jgi:hypothetical protein
VAQAKKKYSINSNTANDQNNVKNIAHRASILEGQNQDFAARLKELENKYALQ